ncbi:hypothetical protein F4803DRAFT_315927 [Xylaria telfairii]|nr:hypothetical protein F4803DRAFT_315927 [Xylaria telfairii]
MTVSTSISVSMDIATRQMSIANFDPSPASGIEILGIATATCLLAFFLCLLLCAGLRISCYSWYSSSLGSDVSDAPHIITNSGEKYRSQQLIRKWAGTPPRQPGIHYDGQQDISQTPCSTKPSRISRMKITRRNSVIPTRYYTQIPPRYKPVSRKPLFMRNSVIDSTRLENMTSDMEEGLSLSYGTAVAAPNGLDDFARPQGTAICNELKAMNDEHSGRSFLHYRTTSL